MTIIIAISRVAAPAMQIGFKLTADAFFDFFESQLRQRLAE